MVFCLTAFEATLMMLRNVVVIEIKTHWSPSYEQWFCCLCDSNLYAKYGVRKLVGFPILKNLRFLQPLATAAILFMFFSGLILHILNLSRQLRFFHQILYYGPTIVRILRTASAKFSPFLGEFQWFECNFYLSNMKKTTASNVTLTEIACYSK